MAYTAPPDLVFGDVVTTTIVNGLKNNDSANWELFRTAAGLATGEHWNTGAHDAVRVPRACCNVFFDYTATAYRLISTLNVASVARVAAGRIDVTFSATPAAASLFADAASYGVIIVPDRPHLAGYGSRTSGSVVQVYLYDIAGTPRDMNFSLVAYGARRL